MSLTDSEHIKGLSDLGKLLDTLPLKLEVNIMRGAFRAGMKIVLDQAKENTHDISGDLDKGLKIYTRARNGMVTASIRATGIHGTVAHLLEFGVAGHWIRAADKGALSFGGGFVKAVYHPGFTGKAFMRPALDARGIAAVNAAAEYMRRRATKAGLDTRDVELEGDET